MNFYFANRKSLQYVGVIIARYKNRALVCALLFAFLVLVSIAHAQTDDKRIVVVDLKCVNIPMAARSLEFRSACPDDNDVVCRERFCAVSAYNAKYVNDLEASMIRRLAAETATRQEELKSAEIRARKRELSMCLLLSQRPEQCPANVPDADSKK